MSSAPTPSKLGTTSRLALLQGGLVLLGIGALVISLEWAAQRGERMSAVQEMQDQLRIWGSVFAHSGQTGLQSLHGTSPTPTHGGYRLLNATGQTLADELSQRTLTYPLPTASPTQAQDERSTHLVTDDALPGDLLLGFHHLEGGQTLWLARFDDEARARIRHLRYWLWGLAIFAASIMLLPIGWASSELVRPLHLLARRAAQLAESDSAERLADRQTLPELHRIAEVFDGERDRINALTNELQSANDLLAHELRTPLARIRGNLERLLKAPDDAKAQAAVAHGLDEIDRAAALMQKILTTRAGDHKALKLHLQIVDLAELLDHVHELYQPAAEERGLELRFVAHRTCLFLMDRQMLTQAVANLLDNALAYTPKGGWVELSIDVAQNSAYVRVTDNGPGMRDEIEMERIWHRFVRGSVASAQTPGMGLGLNLVRAIAMAHGGKATCQNRADGGAEFCLVMPVVAPS